jgi:hypothetical protein
MSRVIRVAREDELATLNALVEDSVRGLSGPYHTPAEIDAFCRYVFSVDAQLIHDGTYFVVEEDGARAASTAGFTRLALMSTLPGVPFYEALGFMVVATHHEPLPDGHAFPHVQMERTIRA